MSEIKPYRFGVVGVFTNTSSQILLCERANAPGAWQFPQGGIDEGEQPEETLLREVEEELGTSSFKILDRSGELTTYDFPAEASFNIAKKFRGQKHYWFHLRFVEGGKPDLAKSDGEFIDTKWVPIADALQASIPWKKDAYAHGLRLLGIGDF